MRDLKHLLYFENLLQEANNALIAQAKSEGKVCVAYTCENVPEPLLNLDGAFSIRIERGGRHRKIPRVDAGSVFQLLFRRG